MEKSMKSKRPLVLVSMLLVFVLACQTLTPSPAGKDITLTPTQEIISELTDTLNVDFVLPNDAYVYWEILVPSRNNIKGWVAEGDLSSYYIEPLK
jgi:hypothetical protein